MNSYEILPGLPAYGAPARTFGAHGHNRFCEGFVVKFANQTTTWVGNFMGGGSKFRAVVRHPNDDWWCVIANGKGYIIDPTRSMCLEEFGNSIDCTFTIEQPSRVVSGDGLRFECLGATNFLWKSRRISFDGMRNITVRDRLLRGEAYAPYGDGEWIPFVLNLDSGSVEGGSYPPPQ